MFRRTSVVLLCLLSMSCSRKAAQQGAVWEPHQNASDSLEEFEITPTSLPNQWLARYASKGKTAKFRIELGPTKDSGDTSQPFSFGKGKFLREPGSDPTIFLADLATVLQAKVVATKVQPVDTLNFGYTVLARGQARSANDSFSNSPAGNWTATKIFLGDDEGEVFFNFSPSERKAEFSIKDADYGDYVISELAKVF